MHWVHEAWVNGEVNNIPMCCRVQFILDSLVHRNSPVVVSRLMRLSPRAALADGVKPCWYHTIRWVLTGKPCVSHEDRHYAGECCDARGYFQSQGIARIHSEVVGIDGEESVEFFLVIAGGEEDIHIRNCPWCGTALGHGGLRC